MVLGSNISGPTEGNEAGRGNKVLVLGTYRQSLATIRALDRSGHDVVAWQDRPIGFHAASRHVKEVWRHFVDLEDGTAWIQALAGFLQKRRDIGYLIPTGDMEVYALASHHAALPRDVVSVMPSPDVALFCLDKRLQLKLADDLGVPQRPFRIAASLSELFQAGNEVGFPCIVKSAAVDPSRFRSGVLGNKAVICSDHNEMKSVFSSWPGDQHDDLVVQGFAAGKRRIIAFQAYAGEVAGLGEIEVLHNSDIGRAVEGITIEPDLRMTEACRRMIKTLGYSGLGSLDYLFDAEAGTFCFLEINPRTDGNLAVFEPAGLNLPALAIASAQGGPVQASGNEKLARPGVRFVWTYGDLAGLLGEFRRSRNLGSAAKGLIRCCCAGFRGKVHLTWSLADPRPTIVVFIEAFQRLFR